MVSTDKTQKAVDKQPRKSGEKCTMRCCYYEKYGNPSVLKVGDLPIPQISTPNEVLIRVHAVGLNPMDFKRRNGALRAVLKEISWPIITASDLSGVIARRGSQATKFEVGEEVFCSLPLNVNGALAEFVLVPEDYVAKKPKVLSHNEAAAVPLVSIASLQCLERANVQPDHRVLITAGAGGVGSVAIQMAKNVFKVKTVATTVSELKLKLAGELGADIVINYQKKKLKHEIRDFDVAIDCTGEAKECMDVLKRGGCVVSIADTPPQEGFEGMEGTGVRVTCCTGFVLNCLSHSMKKKARRLGVDYSYQFCSSTGEKLKQIACYYEKGHVQPLVDKVFSFHDCLDAISFLESGQAVGKVVVQISPELSSEKADVL